MQFIPEWAPNIHPLIIHFPIVLLLIALLAEFVGILFKEKDWLRKAAVSLFVFGALGTIVSYVTGKQAADVVHFPANAYSVLSEHADLALYTTIFFNLYALIRIFIYWKKWDLKRSVTGILLLVAVAGYGLVQQTAEHGGMLVYKYGVGTPATKIKATASAKKDSISNSEKIRIAKNGSWSWKSDVRQFKKFNLMLGQWEKLELNEITRDKESPYLRLSINSQKPFLLTFGPKLRNTQLSVNVDLSRFKGRFFIVNHVLSPTTYDFLSMDGSSVRLGRMQGGEVSYFDSGKTVARSWTKIKFISSKGHFRGYVNDKLVVHGHASGIKAGPAGLAFSGVGELKIKDFNVVALDKKSMLHEENEENHSH